MTSPEIEKFLSIPQVREAYEGQRWGTVGRMALMAGTAKKDNELRKFGSDMIKKSKDN